MSLSKYFKISEKPKISWFTHIFGNTHDYTCGYYSYMLSDVVACNFLNRFLSDKDVTKYIETVLKVGN